VNVQATATAVSPWADSLHAAALFAVDPAGLGGIALRAASGPVREQWLAHLRAWLPRATPLRKMPLHIADDRLLGGLDLAATLRAGRPVAQRGLLAESDGGVLLLAMAERLEPGTAARLAAVMDTGEAVLARDGLALRSPCRIGIVALDEGLDDERFSPALADRLAFHIDLSAVSTRDTYGSDEAGANFDEDVAAARARLPAVVASDEMLEALCSAAMMLGIASVRAPLLALRAARASAALDGRDAVSAEDAACAARLVLAPRATCPPPAPAPEDAEPEAEEPPPPDDKPPETDADDQTLPTQPIEDLVLAAAQAAIPPGLLARLRLAEGALARMRGGGRSGLLQASRLRGRPAGTRRGEPRAGARLNLIATLRAAAPWQRLRRHERPAAPGQPERIEVRAQDFQVTRFKQRSETTAIFVIDASGSSALHRLAEAKGAVEMLLADCYVRRDRVAVLAFRGHAAELLLPPTRSLVRAKRSLAGLPGGGGTPLAAGIAAALALADATRRRGETPLIVVLTDGRANIGLDGNPGRAHADEDAQLAARGLRAAALACLLVDTSPQPQPAGQRLAEAMGATYLPLPHAGAATLSQAVRAASAPAGARIG
jgi:magnesium chelatase subunit D